MINTVAIDLRLFREWLAELSTVGSLYGLWRFRECIKAVDQVLHEYCKEIGQSSLFAACIIKNDRIEFIDGIITILIEYLTLGGEPCLQLVMENLYNAQFQNADDSLILNIFGRRILQYRELEKLKSSLVVQRLTVVDKYHRRNLDFVLGKMKNTEELE